MGATRTRFLLRAALLPVLASPARADDRAPAAGDDFCAPRTKSHWARPSSRGSMPKRRKTPGAARFSMCRSSGSSDRPTSS